MDIIFVKQDSIEWNAMWDYLSKHPINEGLEYPKIAYNNGESWQYMGSFKQGDKIIAEFRHRKHPKTQNVYKVLFNHSVSDDSIDKVIKVK